MTVGVRSVRCDGRCDEFGCRSHDVLTFENCSHLAEDAADLLHELFAELRERREQEEHALGAETDRDRAHGIVHAMREALITTLRTKSWAKVRDMIGLIDEWKKQYAIAAAIEESPPSACQEPPLVRALTADEVRAIQPVVEKALEGAFERLAEVFEKAGTPIEHITSRIAMTLAGAACGAAFKTLGWDRAKWMEQMGHVWTACEGTAAAERMSPGGQA